MRPELRAALVARCLGPAGALFLTGCSPLARASVLPTFGPRGDVGVEAKLTVALGVVNRFDHLRAPPHTPIDVVAFPLSLGGGTRRHGSSSTQNMLTLDGGAELDHIGSDVRDLGFRLAGLVSSRAYDPRPYTSLGGTLQGALLLTAWKGKPSELLGMSGSSLFALGPTVDASWMTEPGGSSGRFGAGLTFDWYRLTQWTVR